MGSGVDPSMTLHALLGPRDRDNCFLLRFLKQQIIHPALLRGRERCTYPLFLGRPSRGLLLLHLPPVDGGQDGLLMPSSTAPLLKAAADAVRERGWMQGATLGDEQAGRCNRRTGGGRSCPPMQDLLDPLSLLLCSRELLGHVTGCVAEEASLGYRNLEETNFFGVPMSTRHSQRWRSSTTSVDIARPRDRAITFAHVARGQVQCGALSELPDRDHPRACPSVLLA